MIYRRERSSGQNGGLRTTWTNCAYGRTSGVFGSFLGVICFGFLNFFLPHPHAERLLDRIVCVPDVPSLRVTARIEVTGFSFVMKLISVSVSHQPCVKRASDHQT